MNQFISPEAQERLTRENNEAGIIIDPAKKIHSRDIVKLELVESASISTELAHEINNVAAIGFGQDPTAMLDDTVDHVRSSELLHLAHTQEGLAGFAMYKSCLWQ